MAKQTEKKETKPRAPRTKHQPASKKEEIEGIPEIYKNYPESWKKSYQHAIGTGCSSKAAALFADAHGGS